LKDSKSLGVVQNLETVFQHRNLALRINRPDQQRLVNILWPDIFHGLLHIVRLHFIAPYHEAVPRRNPQLELLPVTDHIEGRGAHNWEQPDHVQHRRLPRQHITANFFVISDVAFLYATCGRINVHRRLQRLDLFRLLVDGVN